MKLKRIRCIVDCYAPVGYDMANIGRLVALLNEPHSRQALGFRATLVDAWDGRDSTDRRTRLLSRVASELHRTGFDELPEELEGHPLELRLSLSFSGAGDEPALYEPATLVRRLRSLGDGELAALGVAPTIALFDGLEAEDAIDQVRALACEEDDDGEGDDGEGDDGEGDDGEVDDGEGDDDAERAAEEEMAEIAAAIEGPSPVPCAPPVASPGTSPDEPADIEAEIEAAAKAIEAS